MRLFPIFLLSCLTLFLEMLLIRWLGTEIRVFAYVQNGVLIAAFLGLGVGCARASRPVRLLPSATCLGALGFVIRDPFDLELGDAITQRLTGFEDSVVWGQQLSAWNSVAAVAFALGITMGILLSVSAIMFPFGQWLGRWLSEAERPIAAYSADVAGSIAGILLFQMLTVAWTAPWVWLTLAAVGILWLLPRSEDAKRTKLVVAALLIALPVFGTSTAAMARWSPYQKLVLTSNPLEPADCSAVIAINGTFYQHMVNLDPAHLAANPQRFPPSDVRASQYILPYELIGKRNKAVVVGAGSGNDVAAALRAGVDSVHAVEIDPVILEWGKRLHPNRPYASPKVHVHVDDARAFLQNTRSKYDVAWFGLLDSHTNPSAYTNIRLDHYVYTREALERVRDLLTPDGVVVMYFEATRAWIAKRLLGLLSETFRAQPLTMRVPRMRCLAPGGYLLIAGTRQAIAPVWQRAMSDPQLAKLVRGAVWKNDVELTTDDWPYLYLLKPSVPTYHLCVGAAAIALMLLMTGGWGLREKPDWVMFLLGAGFMLLEVTAVSRAALFFGTTWIVNAYVIAAILVMVLLANLVVTRVRFRSYRWIVAGVSSSLLLLYFVPQQVFLGLPLWLRVPVAGAFLALPVLFAGVFFTSEWKTRERRDHAFGSNLIGSLVGGVVSLLSMWLGFKALALLALVFYLAAYARARRAPAL